MNYLFWFLSVLCFVLSVLGRRQPDKFWFLMFHLWFAILGVALQ
jgi:hypothetical protein